MPPSCVFFSATNYHRADAYQYGNTIIVEDEDGEVVKKYDIPAAEKKRRQGNKDGAKLETGAVRNRLQRMISGREHTNDDGQPSKPADETRLSTSNRRGKSAITDDDDDRLRFTITSQGQRMSKNDFIKQIQSLDPKARARVVEDSDVPEGVKEDARRLAAEHVKKARESSRKRRPPPPESATSYNFPAEQLEDHEHDVAVIQKIDSSEDRPKGDEGLTLVDSHGADIPLHTVSDTVSKYSAGQPETAASRRRRLAARKDSDDDGTTRVPPSRSHPSTSSHNTTLSGPESLMANTGETNAERRRRLAAFGEEGSENNSDSEDDGGERKPKGSHHPVEEPSTPARAPGIRFADSPAVSQGRVQWSEDVGKRGRAR